MGAPRQPQWPVPRDHGTACPQRSAGRLFPPSRYSLWPCLLSSPFLAGASLAARLTLLHALCPCLSRLSSESHGSRTQGSISAPSSNCTLTSYPHPLLCPPQLVTARIIFPDPTCCPPESAPLGPIPGRRCHQVTSPSVSSTIQTQTKFLPFSFPHPLSGEQSPHLSPTPCCLRPHHRSPRDPCGNDGSLECGRLTGRLPGWEPESRPRGALTRRRPASDRSLGSRTSHGECGQGRTPQGPTRPSGILRSRPQLRVCTAWVFRPDLVF